ncbi:hypothetical protein HBI09_070350 [Parastagonospora nodorum]|nr:hypothetical protein HBI09_070350 [Parastagonospora nodorum]KAH5017670.1 hypothetical protein HBI77_055840 [Parastagonospora nodorum]
MLSSYITRRFSSSGVVPSGEASSDDGTPSTPQLACDSPPNSPPDSISTATRDATEVSTAENRPASLIERFRRYSSFSRPAQDAVEEEDDNGLTTCNTTLAAPIPISRDTSMPQDSSRILDDELRQLSLDPAPSSAPATPSGLNSRPTIVQRNATTVSESLPADDGMAHLRDRIHQIRVLKITEQERARMVHSLMTERYNHMRPTSPSSFISHDRPFTPNSSHSVFSDAQASSLISAASDIDPENPYSLRPGDTNPTYRPPRQHAVAENGEEEEDDAAGDPPSLGCQHYKRNVKVQCFDCLHWYTCRHCHDAVETHSLNRKLTQHMLCMACGTPQKAGDHCINCQTPAACYYCDICKLWDNNSKKSIYHCPDCGICRRGAGLGKDFYHCKDCNVCIGMQHHGKHKCLADAIDNDCPICSEYLFTSSAAVVSMPCGHYLHKECYNLYMETAYKCPICQKSAVSMALQWQKLTHAIESQPMPEQFENTRAIIQCNDCSAKSSVRYHWLGNQCGTCHSYNTNELRIVNDADSEDTANAMLEADANAGSRSPVSVSSPTSQPLRSPRYYFQPDVPEETWLPAQLPTFPFQLPNFPGRPRMPQMPQMPQFPSLPQFPQMARFPQMPQFPQIPQFPQMPQMPEAAQEVLERVRKSMYDYLNPSGDIHVDDVPVIDLGDDDRRERTATDGTVVKEPSLPQYVIERFTQSLARFRDDLNPGLEDVPALDLTDDHDPGGLQFWGEDGGRLERILNANEEDDDSSTDESEHEESDEEDDDDEGEVDGRGFDLPGHR